MSLLVGPDPDGKRFGQGGRIVADGVRNAVD
jgi:hypothetical protein